MKLPYPESIHLPAPDCWRCKGTGEAVHETYRTACICTWIPHVFLAPEPQMTKLDIHWATGENSSWIHRPRVSSTPMQKQLYMKLIRFVFSPISDIYIRAEARKTAYNWTKKWYWPLLRPLDWFAPKTAMWVHFLGRSDFYGFSPRLSWRHGMPLFYRPYRNGQIHYSTAENRYVFIYDATDRVVRAHCWKHTKHAVEVVS